MVRLTDRPDMTVDVYCGRKTTIQQTAFTYTAMTTSASCELNIMSVSIDLSLPNNILF